jgi:class 3 adenylate cyclase
MSEVLQRFGGVAIKNCGDSLFFYFPEAPEQKSGFIFHSCIDCITAMADAQKSISENLEKEGLPSLNYRVSADYGKVAIMNPTNISGTDLVGPPVNISAKINRKAEKNGIVIGGDLYLFVKNFECCYFEEKPSLLTGVKGVYPVYSVHR